MFGDGHNANFWPRRLINITACVAYFNDGHVRGAKQKQRINGNGHSPGCRLAFATNALSSIPRMQYSRTPDEPHQFTSALSQKIRIADALFE